MSLPNPTLDMFLPFPFPTRFYHADPIFLGSCCGLPKQHIFLYKFIPKNIPLWADGTLYNSLQGHLPIYRLDLNLTVGFHARSLQQFSPLTLSNSLITCCKVSAATSQLCHCCRKGIIDTKEMNEYGCVPIKRNLQKRTVNWISSTQHSC